MSVEQDPVPGRTKRVVKLGPVEVENQRLHALNVYRAGGDLAYVSGCQVHDALRETLPPIRWHVNFDGTLAPESAQSRR